MAYKSDRVTYHLSMDREILEKARDLVDTMPAETLSNMIEVYLESRIKQYEDEYDELDRRSDLCFDVPLKKKPGRYNRCTVPEDD